MKYKSTRGEAKPVDFIGAVLGGLARDGGLFVPENIPNISDKISAFSTLSYCDLAFEIISPFVDSEISKTDLKNIIYKSYSSFHHSEITPLCFLKNQSILELFHGPTLAFKDIALQFLGNLFSYLLEEKKTTLNILGATSGDTGSAAIHGIKGKKGISIFMLYPKGKVSPIQEKQMTTVLDENVHNIAIDGTFDDAQAIVKTIFNNLTFKDKYHLGAVNSINWARIMAQIVYYFYATFRFQEKYPNEPIYFSVPTGNFGDIYAGYLAKKMGLPIEKLIIATNENKILSETLKTGIYKINKVVPTVTPSMDIQVSSNFERFLYDILEKNGSSVKEKMKELQENGMFQLSKHQLKIAKEFFVGISINEEETLECIKKIYQEENVLLDPHTAVGVVAAQKYTSKNVICLATAHPAKFGDAVKKASNIFPKFPPQLTGILTKPTKSLETVADVTSIQNIIETHVH